MTPLTRLAHIRLSDDVYERAQKAAEADRRSLANWLAVTIERALDEKPREPAGAAARPARSGQGES